MKNLIVAHDKNRVIGFEGEMPWQGELPTDLKKFRALTLGYPVIMGRLTFESIGRPLPGRENIVLSRSRTPIEGCTVVAELDEAYEVAGDMAETFVIGGAKVYELAMPQIDRLYITEIDASFKGDTFFVEVDPDEWALTEETSHPSDETNRYAYRFITYERVKNDNEGEEKSSEA